MFLSIHPDIVLNSSGKELKEIKKDPVLSLPEELIVHIFCGFNLTTLATISCVNKKWRQIASESSLWRSAIYREIAFGSDKWVQYFGENIIKDEDRFEELHSLPFKDFITDSRKFYAIFPEKSVRDSLLLVRLPKTLNSQLTLKNLEELVNRCFSTNNSTSLLIWSPIIKELIDESITSSHWVIMTKSLLPGSKKKSYSEQEEMIAGLSKKSIVGYRIPTILESVVCILSEYSSSKTQLFTDYTRCRNQIQGYTTVVGGLSASHLSINHNYESDKVGVVALRNFEKEASLKLLG